MSAMSTEADGEPPEIPRSAYIGYTGFDRESPSFIERFLRIFSPEK